jgi:hypothetical protein
VLNHEKPKRVGDDALKVRPRGRGRRMTQRSRVVLGPSSPGSRAHQKNRGGHLQQDTFQRSASTRAWSVFWREIAFFALAACVHDRLMVVCSRPG